MIKNALNSIQDVSVYPIISLLIFVGFFVILGYMVFKADKKYIEHMEELPLDED
ncbi:MAG: CcoQ/FixQ family Cbb3-type cytochrome c oxidase assembly chaperone [Cytophagaceae bacterium]|nr:CcoQ/FixQ family Cbb3-type cytochrome c oxidase assembly chaperone [Cytophagaceae bacterium]